MMSKYEITDLIQNLRVKQWFDLQLVGKDSCDSYQVSFCHLCYTSMIVI